MCESYYLIICLSIICLSVYHSIYLSFFFCRFTKYIGKKKVEYRNLLFSRGICVFLSVHLPVSVCLSMYYLYVCLSDYLSSYHCSHLSICLFIHLFVYKSIYNFIYLPIHTPYTHAHKQKD